MNEAVARYDAWVERMNAEEGVHATTPQEHETDATNTTPSRKGIIGMIEEFASIASILRMGGAAIVVASMSAFLMQGWAGGNDIGRFYMLLSQTILLALGGFGLSYVLKENKGARVFFGLSIISIVADMTTLGALVFSIAHWGKILAHYPAFAHWKATSSVDMMMATVAGVVTLIPIAWFGFLVMARRSAKALAITFLAANLLLLVPVRESWVVGVLAMLGVLLPVFTARRAFAQDPAIRTVEGYFAIATLFIPAGIIICRSLYLYEMDSLLQFMLAMTAYTVLRFIGSSLVQSPRFASKLALLSFVTAGVAAQAISGLFDPRTLGQFLAFGLTFGALGMDIALRNPAQRQPYATFTCGVFAMSALIPFIAIHDSASILTFILSGAGVCIAGKALDAGKPVLMGVAMMIAGIGQQLYSIVVLMDFSNWFTLAVLGTSAIVTASVIERHGAVIKVKCQKWLNEMKQ